jgi:pyruvate,water dikinase
MASPKDRSKELILWFEDIRKEDIPLVGGKNANLGEMIASGIPVPHGFAVTAYSYKKFITDTGIADKVYETLNKADVNNADALNKACAKIRQMIEEAKMPKDIEEAIKENYADLSKKYKQSELFVAVRSSATAEDLPDASFAGQQETFLNVKGDDDLLIFTKKCWSSLFTPRATFYRHDKGFRHEDVLLSVAVQKMVNSRTAGVMFTLDISTGEPDVIVIESNWGLGEAVVSGAVTPDSFHVNEDTLQIVGRNLAVKHVEYLRDPKSGGVIHSQVPPERQNIPSLSDEEIVRIAELGKQIEKHYGREMDIEWAVDREMKFPESVFLVQARAETVWSKKLKAPAETVPETTEKKVVCKGMSASPGNVSGVAKIIPSVEQIDLVKQGDLLVTSMTTPDWVPAMRKACAIVTEEGGATCHAAIVSRELGIPCIVGTGNAMAVMKDGSTYTIDGKAGVVYEGRLADKKPASETAYAKGTAVIAEGYTPTATKIYMNLGIPEKISDYGDLPFDGIGLMRLEFIIATYVKAHPMDLIAQGKAQFYIDKLAEGIGMVAKAINPRPVVVRFSDFKTNEYRDLPGGEKYEPKEDNPMIGWRGVSRYISPGFEKAFRLECQAIKKCREEFRLKNVWIMLPFVRTEWEVERCLKIIDEEGLKKNRDFKIWAMAEVPSIVFNAAKFYTYFDGFSIGSNDLTQLTIGADRDSELLGNMGYTDERDPAVVEAIRQLIVAAHKAGKTISICGQAPSNMPDFVEFLVSEGITSVSVNPDAVVATRKLVAGIEKKVMLTKLRHLEEEGKGDCCCKG